MVIELALYEEHTSGNIKHWIYGEQWQVYYYKLPW